MGRPSEPKPIGPRVTINTQLSASFINTYWKKIPGMSEAMWTKTMSPAQRYEMTIQHMIEQLGGDGESG